jgi:hypothetical protein
MAKQQVMTKTKSKRANRKSTKPRTQLSMFRGSIIALGAAIAGVVAAVPLTLAAVMPMVRQQIAADTAGLTSRTLQVQPAADTLSCVQPTQASAGTGGQVLGASTTQQPTTPGGGKGAGSGGGTPTTVFVKKLVNGVFTSSGTISNTGPGSSNSITTHQTATTTVTNDNDISVTNLNHQDSSSGDAEVEGNTTGGSATTGDASNTNSSNFDLTVSN